VEPLVVLILLPVLIGVAAEAYFRDPARASLAATIVSPTVVYICLTTLDPGGTWNWLAALLVTPFAIALALAAVMVCFGRSQVRRRPRRNGA
jgi:hypothetical protein